MQEIFDQFLWTKENKVITRDRHHVPGLANFSHWNFRSATTPAVEHYHSGIFEIHCMIRGRRIFQAQQGDSLRAFTVTGSQAAITFPGQPHGYIDNFVEPYEFYSLQVDVREPEHMLGLSPEYGTALCRDLLSLQDRMTASGEQRLELGATHINLIRTAFTFFSYFDEDAIRMGTQFLSCFCGSLKYLSPVSLDPRVDEPVSAAIEYMREHFMDKPPLQEIAEKAGYSLSYFKARFKEETGITPAGYLSMLRLEYAKDRLAGSSMSITKLAADLNFSSPSHFCSAFKKYTSYTPKEYRERKQGG